MAAPAANFTYNPIGLSIQFVDRSTGVPTSWSWDFGDGGSSIMENPNHIYALPGPYNVTLSITNGDGTSTTQQMLIVSTTAQLHTSIYDMVKGYLSGTDIILDGARFNTAKEQWQLLIGPQLDPPVADPDIFNEEKYPGLANVLIAKLIVYDFAWASMGGTLISSGAGANSAGGGSGSMKRVETGPSNAEWYNPADSLDAMFRRAGKSGSAYDQFITGICMLATRMGVSIPEICPQIQTTILPIKATTRGGCGNCGPGAGIIGIGRGIPSKGGWPWLR